MVVSVSMSVGLLSFTSAHVWSVVSCILGEIGSLDDCELGTVVDVNVAGSGRVGGVGDGFCEADGFPNRVGKIALRSGGLRR